MFKTLILSFWVVLHPVHVSVLSIDYEAAEKRFDVFFRLYYDDFLIDSGLADETKKKLIFSPENAFTRNVLMNYVNDKVKIYVNDRQVNAEIKNTDLSDNELRMNLSVEEIKRIKSIRVQNLVMTSLYNDQANMIIVKVNDFEEGVKLTAEETEKIFLIN